MDTSHPLVALAGDVFEEQFGRSCRFRTWDFSTNGVSTKGKYDIPTIGFGPGQDELAHRPDEKVPIAHLSQAMAFYAALAKAWQEGR
jgi:acetylornithine deacetylase/succinyl-diaminopimelate desuccinylase-like protein